MAKCKMGPLVQGISGSLGALTFYTGARAGQVSMRPRRSNPEKGAIALTRIFNQKRLAQWRSLDTNYHNAWDTWAKSQKWPDAFGMPKTISGQHAWNWYMSAIDPTAEGTAFPYPSFPLGSLPTLTIADVNFTAGGAHNIELVSYGPATPWEYMHIRRTLEWGQRDSAHRRLYIGLKTRNANPLNWADKFSELGIILRQGELVQVDLYWCFLGALPSLKATGYTTVK